MSQDRDAAPSESVVVSCCAVLCSPLCSCRSLFSAAAAQSEDAFLLRAARSRCGGCRAGRSDHREDNAPLMTLRSARASMLHPTRAESIRDDATVSDGHGTRGESIERLPSIALTHQQAACMVSAMNRLRTRQYPAKLLFACASGLLGLLLTLDAVPGQRLCSAPWCSLLSCSPCPRPLILCPPLSPRATSLDKHDDHPSNHHSSPAAALNQQQPS